MKRGRYQSPRKPIRKIPLLAAGIGILAAVLICGWILSRSPAQDALEEAAPVEKLENTAAIPGFEELVLKADTKKADGCPVQPTGKHLSVSDQSDSGGRYCALDLQGNQTRKGLRPHQAIPTPESRTLPQYDVEIRMLYNGS